MNPDSLKDLLLSSGATLTGVGDVTEALSGDIRHLTRGIAIAVRKDLNRDTVEFLLGLQGLIEAWLRKRNYRFLTIPPDSDRRNGKFISRLYEFFSHKTAATCAGLGWIGKNGLIINSRYGPKLSWATVLTDAPFMTDRPITKSLCGNCNLCVRHCPSSALTGTSWSIGEPFSEIVIYSRCSSLKKKRTVFNNKPNCGLCINICPYARKVYKNNKRERIYLKESRSCQ